MLMGILKRKKTMTNKTKGWLMLSFISIIVFGFIFYIGGFYELLLCIATVVIPICAAHAIILIEIENNDTP